MLVGWRGHLVPIAGRGRIHGAVAEPPLHAQSLHLPTHTRGTGRSQRRYYIEVCIAVLFDSRDATAIAGNTGNSRDGFWTASLQPIVTKTTTTRMLYFSCEICYMQLLIAIQGE